MSTPKCEVDQKGLSYDRTCLLSRSLSGFIFKGSFCGTPVAVKRVQLVEIDSIGSGKEWAEKESLLRNLINPNIVQFIHAEDEPTFRLFVFELCSASMDQLFLPKDNPKKYSGPIPTQCQALMDIVQGLQYIHSNGFLISCFQPKNILIYLVGMVHMKISGWCVRNSYSSSGSLNVQGARGMLDWMAPEFLILLLEDMNTKISGSVEGVIFSTGCIFFYFLTGGIHPFGNALTTAGNIANGTPANLSKMRGDHFARDLIRGMIFLEPTQRITLRSILDYLSTPRMKFMRTVREVGLPKSLAQPKMQSRKRKYFPGQNIFGPVGGSKTPILAFHPHDTLLAYYTCRSHPEQPNADPIVFWSGPNHSSPFSSWTKEMELDFREIIPTANISCMEWSSDGTKFSAGFDCGSFIIWNQNGDILFQNDEGRHLRRLGESFTVFGIHWNPFHPSKVLFQSLSELPLFDTEKMKIRRHLFPRLNQVTCVRKIVDVEWISADTLVVCFSDSQAIEIWRVGRIDPIKILNIGVEGIQGINPDGVNKFVRLNVALDLLVSCHNQQIQIWLKGVNDPLHNISPNECSCVSWFFPRKGVENPRHLLACGLVDGTVLIWCLQDRVQMIPVSKLTELTLAVEDVAFSPCGRFFAAVDTLGSTVIWSTESWDPVYEHQENPAENIVTVDRKGVYPVNFEIITRHRLRWSPTGCKMIVNRSPSDPYSTKPDGISLIEFLPSEVGE